MIVGIDGGKPNSDKNWRNHMIVLDASNKAKYSASVEERTNKFVCYDMEMHEPDESLIWMDTPNCDFLSECDA